MTHAKLVSGGRKEHVKPTVCTGELSPVESRRQWVRGSVEKVYQCDDCQSVLGLVGDTVEWSMNLSDWKTL